MWGDLQPDGTFSGMLGTVHRGEADVSVAGFAVTLDRSLAVSFSVLTLKYYMALFVKRPSLHDISLDGYLAEYESITWCVIIILVIITNGATLIFLLKVQPQISFGDHAWTSFLFSTNCFIGKGTPSVPKVKLISMKIYWLHEHSKPLQSIKKKQDYFV